MRILVVDDSKPVRSILSKMLRDAGCDVVEATDGAQAVQRLEDGLPVDLAFINWNMPVMDGEHLLNKIRTDKRFAKLPVVVLSATDDSGAVTRAMAAGANAFLAKPVARESLLEQIYGLCTTLPTTALRAPAHVASIPAIPSHLARASGSEQRPVERQDQGGDRMKSPIRVLIVDDSVVVRGVLSSLLAEDPELTVAGTAADGRIALEKIKGSTPDLVLLDIEMPNLDGLETLREVRKSHPRLPVVMFSSLTDRGAKATTDALLLGATDYVFKPGGAFMRDLDSGKQAIRRDLIPKLKLHGRPTRPAALSPKGVIQSLPYAKPALPKSPRIDVVAIGVSTGGPKALADLLPKIAPACNVPILIVQHMPPIFTGHLAERLTVGYGLQVQEAVHGNSVENNQIYLARGGQHLEVYPSPGGARLRLTDQSPVNSCRPSVDVLFNSLAEVYRGNVLAIILTGMGDDGSRGAKRLYDLGATVFVQDVASSVVWGMPGSAVRAGCVDRVLSLEEMGQVIPQLLSRRQGTVPR